MHENQLSQFRPNESQRSRNVPDVLFVDEDGNPIEAGEENLIFINEDGIEITEEKAIKLIESGKYIDSRVLYDDELGLINRSNSTNYGSVNSYSSNVLNSISFNQAKKSNSLTHAQIQAAQALQIAQTQAKLNAVTLPSADTINPSSSNLSTQAKIFADARIKAREQAEELAEIEADAYSNYSPSHKASYHSEDVQKIKPKSDNYSEETFDLDKIISDQEKILRKSNSDKESVQQFQKFKENFHFKQKRQEEEILLQQQEQEREFLKNQLLRKQEELMEQHLFEKQQQELEIHQAKLEKEERRRLKREKKEQKEKERRQREQEKELKEKRRLREQELQIQKDIEENWLKEQEKLEMVFNEKRKNYELERQKSVESKKSLEKQKSMDSKKSMERQKSKESKKSYDRKKLTEKETKNLQADFDGNFEKSYPHKKLQKAKSLNKISRNSSRSTILEKENSKLSQINKHCITARSSNKFVNQELILSPQNQISEFSKDYNVVDVSQVGYLTGSNLIRNCDDIDLNRFEQYYDHNSNLEFKSHNLDNYSTQFIDPFSANLFKDEMVDIDFGAIDAFTEALNAQIIAEKNGDKFPKNLQFPSHVLASNHASFLDNQIFLGDCSNDEHSGVNVEFLSNNLKRKEKSVPKQEDDNSSMLERAAKAEYSKNQSFGSIINFQNIKNQNENKLNSGINKSNNNLLNSLDSFIQSRASSNAKNHSLQR